MIQESIHTCSDIVHYNCMSSSRSMRVSRYAIRATTPHHGYAGVQFALRHTGGNLATHDNCGLSVTGFSSRAECEGVAARSWLRRYVVESTVRGWCETDSGTGILHGSNRILSLAHFAMLFWAHTASRQPSSKATSSSALAFCVRQSQSAELDRPMIVHDTYSVRKTYLDLVVETPAPLSRVQ
jgi:hypothetical protein